MSLPEKEKSEFRKKYKAELAKESAAFKTALNPDHSDEINGGICIEFLKRFHALEEEAKKELSVESITPYHLAIKKAFGLLIGYLPDQEDSAQRFLGEVIYGKGLIDTFNPKDFALRLKANSASESFLKTIPKQHQGLFANHVWQLQAKMGDHNFPDVESRRFCVLISPLGETPKVLLNDYLSDHDWNRLLVNIDSVVQMHGLNGDEALHRIVQCFIHSINRDMQMTDKGNFFELLRYDLGTDWNRPLLSMEEFLPRYDQCLLERLDQFIDETIPPVSGNSLRKPEILTYRTIPPCQIDRESYQKLSSRPLFGEHAPTSFVQMGTKEAYEARSQAIRLDDGDKLVAVSGREHEQLFESAAESRKNYLDGLASRMKNNDALFFNNHLMHYVKRRKRILDKNASTWGKNGRLISKEFISVEIDDLKTQVEIAKDLGISKSAVNQRIKRLERLYPDAMNYRRKEIKRIRAQENPILFSSMTKTNSKSGKSTEYDCSDEGLNDNES